MVVEWSCHSARVLDACLSQSLFTGTNQGTITGDNVFMLGLIAEHVVYIISQAERRVRGATRQDVVIELSEEAEEAHSAEILRRAVFYATQVGCTPSYFNGYGEVVE